MKFEVAELSNNKKGVQAIALVSGNDILPWPTKGYKSASIADPLSLFDDLNDFISRYPKEKQDDLWRIYSEISNAFKAEPPQEELDKILKNQIAKIYSIVKYSDVRTFVYQSGTISFPPNLKTEYSENDKRTRNYEVRTYLKEEYVDLVILVMAFRFMVPIWGEYVAAVSKDSGNLFKEAIALDLLSKSEIVEWGPFKRLRSYVEFSIDDNRIGLSVLFGGLSTVELPKHLMGLAVVRKLAVSPLQPKADGDNLIKILYNFVTGTNTRMDSRFGGNVGTKRLIKENGEEDNSSVWDMYKINQDIPDGDKMLIEVFTENPLLMAEKIYPDIDLKKVEVCLARTAKLENLGDYPHQLALCKWVVGKVIPPDGVEVLSKKALLRTLAVTQAVLWQMEMFELALLVTASKVEMDDDVIFTPIESSKIEKLLVERLHVLYPYWRQETGKLDPNKRTNLAVRAIEKVTKEANVCEWMHNSPKEIANAFGGISITKTWRLSSDIRSQLARMILSLYENN
jgi:hypothetical protein